MKTNRVAIALNMLSPYWHEVFDSLCGRGWEVQVFVATEKEKNRDYEAYDYSKYNFRVKTNKNVYINLRFLGIKTEYIHFQWGLWRDLREFKPHVILSNQLNVRTLIAYVYGRRYSVPVVPWMAVSGHTERKNSFLREAYRRFFLRRAPCVCTNLTEAKKYIIEKLKTPEWKIFCTPYVINVDRFNAAVESARKTVRTFREELGLKGFVFLYVGQMIRRKGLNELVMALEYLDEEYLRRCSFLFVGGEFPERLRARLHNLPVTFSTVGFVQPRELPRYYASADAFMFPSLEDEWGIVVNEAAAANLPILCSVYAAVSSDLVKDNSNGIKFDPFNKEELARAIKTILDMPSWERKRLGENSYHLVKSLDIGFTVENMDTALSIALKRTEGNR
jgi:glycosyltransferase involved in cell wall biosynthesis